MAEAVGGDPGGEAGLAAEAGDLFVGGLVAVAVFAVAGDEDPTAGAAAVEVVVEGPDDGGCEGDAGGLAALRVILRTRCPWSWP